MSANWWMAKRKLKLNSTDIITDNDKIRKDRWINTVENDSELVWFENTRHGKEVVEVTLKSGGAFAFKTSAHYEINNKWGHGGMQIIFNGDQGRIGTLMTRITVKRIAKLKEIADKLDLKLFRSRTEVTDDKFKELMQKYGRTGNHLPDN